MVQGMPSVAFLDNNLGLDIVHDIAGADIGI